MDRAVRLWAKEEKPADARCFRIGARRSAEVVNGK